MAVFLHIFNYCFMTLLLNNYFIIIIILLAILMIILKLQLMNANVCVCRSPLNWICTILIIDDNCALFVYAGMESQR